jgi:membrane-associated protease RseP (regulator of RpoE activity)
MTAPPTPPRSRAETSTNWLGLVVLAGLISALWVLGGPHVFVIVMAFVVMIFLHELGHFVTAKRSGMKVTEFFLFFGPEIFSFQRGETRYGIKTIPAGAYVRIIGMNNLDDVADPADEPRTYRSKSYPKKMLVITAGSAMHFVQAAVLLVLFFSFYGQRDPSDWSISEISRLESGPSPAEEAGLELGDRIVAVDGDQVSTFADLREELAPRPGQEVVLTVERDGTVFDTTTTLASVHPNGEPVGFLGVGPRFGWDPLPPGQAVVEAGQLMGEQMWMTVTLVPRFFTPGKPRRSRSQRLRGQRAGVRRRRRGPEPPDGRGGRGPHHRPGRRGRLGRSAADVRVDQRLHRGVQPVPAAAPRRRPRRHRHLRADPVPQRASVPDRRGQAHAHHLRRRGRPRVRVPHDPVARHRPTDHLLRCRRSPSPAATRR